MTVHEIPGLKVKVLHVKAGQVIPLQYHQYHNEHWLVLEGSGRIRCGDIDRDIGKGQVVDIPAGRPHRIEAGDEGISFLEIQQGLIVPGGDAIMVEHG